MTELFRQDQAQTREDNVAAPLLAPVSPPVAPAKIDKSQLAIALGKRSFALVGNRCTSHADIRHKRARDPPAQRPQRHCADQ
jgi:hypothetical protein